MSLIIPRVSLFDQIPLSGKVYLVSRLQDQPWIEAITNIEEYIHFLPLFESSFLRILENTYKL